MILQNHTSRTEKILELENRRKLYELVTQNPGLHFREIERKTKMPHGTLKYNLNFLVKKEILFSKKEQNSIHYFPKGFDIQNAQLLSLLRQETIRKILLFLTVNRSCDHEELTSFTKLSPSTVSWHLKKLSRLNVIFIEKKGRNSLYRLIAKEEIMKLLIIYKESFLDILVDRAIESWEIK